MKRNNYEKPRIGLYSTGLEAYWTQFEGLQERLLAYNAFIAEQLKKPVKYIISALSTIFNWPVKLGDWFNTNQVDIIFVHAATYATSATILPIHQRCQAQVILLNLQPSPQLNYAQTNTGEWLANCGAFPIPEFANGLHRANIRYEIVNGLLGQTQSRCIF